MQFFHFLGGKWPPRGGWKPLPAAMFSMFSWLWRHFPPKISFLVELCTFSPFSWKGPGIRTFRWKGGPCRPTPPKPLCFVSEFQCFARPEKMWKHRIYVFHDFHGFSRKTWNLEKKVKIRDFTSFPRFRGQATPPKSNLQQMNGAAIISPFANFQGGPGMEKPYMDWKVEFLGFSWKLWYFPYFLWFSCFHGISVFSGFSWNSTKRGEENHENDLKYHWFYKGWAGGEAAGPHFGPKSCIFLLFLTFPGFYWKWVKSWEMWGKSLDFLISCCFGWNCPPPPPKP